MAIVLTLPYNAEKVQIAVQLFQKQIDLLDLLVCSIKRTDVSDRPR